MDIVYRCCSGLDVHKNSIKAQLRRKGVAGKRDLNEVRTFWTLTRELLALADWLNREGCTHVAMESTGVYWKPVYNILTAANIEVLLVNAKHIKNVPGRKTDVQDCQWIASTRTASGQFYTATRDSKDEGPDSSKKAIN